jgi:MFS family permease
MNSRRVHFVTLLFAVCYTLSFMDRQVLGLLVEPIKASFALSDTQIGLMQGLSFSIFYVIASIPLARLADHGHRPRIMSACVALWCLMTILAGAAANFWYLMLARIGLAASEAGLPPAAFTMMSDMNEPKHLARANAFFMLSPFVGGGIALTLGGAVYAWAQGWNLHLPGWEHPVEPWRVVFVVIGAPGMLAAAALLLIAEPRPHREHLAAAKTYAAVKEFLRGDRLIFPVFMMTIAMMALLLNASVAWIPAVLMRAHGLSAKQAGVLFGPTFMGAGVLGTLFAGWMISRQGRGVLHRIFGYTRYCVIGAAIPALLGPLVPDHHLQLALFAITLFCTSSVLAVCMVPVLLSAPQSVCAQVIAVEGLITALAGTGVGPMLVGVVSDWLPNSPRSLAVALASVGFGAMVLAALMLQYVLAHSAAASARVDARTHGILQNNTEYGSDTVPAHEQCAAAVAATLEQDV